jgi:CDP-glucose 4,6-dehydratase
MIDKLFWHNKRVFLTGHTGFKGSWMSLFLSNLGATVKGYALTPSTSTSLFEQAKIDKIIDSQIGDIRSQSLLNDSMVAFNPEIVIHMAAQPLVRYSYKNPIETYEINVMGTVNVLESARWCPNLKIIINITTDKCYENDNRDYGYKETDPMGGYDPYSSSKGCAELVTSSYRRSFFQQQNIGVASVRAGNVIGGGDWADDRLIPDILKSFKGGKSVIIRNPKSTRPWQHVLEPLSGYLILAQKLYNDPVEYAGGWNFGPNDKDTKPVSWILNNMANKWGDVNWKLENDNEPHEANFLKLDISKSKSKLDWSPVWGLDYTLSKIIDWHKSWINKKDMQIVCLKEIEQYVKDMK